MIVARVNGEPVELDDGTRLRSVVTSRTDRDTGIAVALNGSVVPRSEWASTRVGHGDRIEILAAAQGG